MGDVPLRPGHAARDPDPARALPSALVVENGAEPDLLLEAIATALHRGELRPFAFHPLGFAGRHARYHAWALACGGELAHACTLIRYGGRWYLQPAASTDAVDVGGSGVGVPGGGEGPVPLNRCEMLLSAVSPTSERGRCTVDYLGSFDRESSCLSCCHADSGHRYAILVERWIATRAVRPLTQIELTRLSQAGVPYERARELAHLTSLVGGVLVHRGFELRRSRLTTVEWLRSLRAFA